MHELGKRKLPLLSFKVFVDFVSFGGRLPRWWILFFFATTSTVRGADEGWFHSHTLASEFQAGETRVRVLLPRDYDSKKEYRSLYVLPVEAGSGTRFGDGLEEVRRLGYHDRYQLVCVAPEFTAPPWFADHDLDPAKRDESHLLKVVIPFVETTYSIGSARQSRHLLGFSKSGWGAISLLLRHPDQFSRVAAWDTGIRIDTGPMESVDRAKKIQDFFGTLENFERYRLSNLVKRIGSRLGPEARLFYYNREGNRGPGGAILHQLMVKHGLPHHYHYEPNRKHRWDSGWIPEAVEFLMESE